MNDRDIIIDAIAECLQEVELSKGSTKIEGGFISDLRNINVNTIGSEAAIEKIVKLITTSTVNQDSIFDFMIGLNTALLLMDVDIIKRLSSAYESSISSITESAMLDDKLKSLIGADYKSVNDNMMVIVITLRLYGSFGLKQFSYIKKDM